LLRQVRASIERALIPEDLWLLGFGQNCHLVARMKFR
jgi:hypothetical protein